ncbi:hypothetical protein LCGC14_0316260 [marine sediment metagenome]|uniref:Uncharacterized protein n=1 Tax=marine sediment metagenome TaxID=412755 RepID=A0A0F9TQT3_9ZZZZ
MAYQGSKYLSKVMNRDGYVIFLPNVGARADLIQTNPPDPYAESVTQLFPLGTKLIQGERIWRYTKVGGVALNIGAVQQQAKAVHAEQDDDIAIGAGFAIGISVISFTGTSNLAADPLNTTNGLAEGYIYFNVAAGLGQCYKIKSHTLVSATEIPLTMYDALTVALTTSSKAGLVQNPFANVIASEAVVAGIVTGVPMLTTTASYYVWLQRGGPAAVAVNTTIALGTTVVAGITAAKVDPEASVTGEVNVGYCMTPGVTAGGDHALIFLTLDS